jgi:UDP-N-acetylglucosamine 2-epimerase (non-hydrolysing)
MEPLGYLEFLKLMSECTVVLTDSGGMQEETTILGVPCMTLRRNTERPVTLTEGTNRLVDPAAGSIVDAWNELQRGTRWGKGRTPELWDGHAAERIVDCLRRSTTGETVASLRPVGLDT